MSENKYNPIFNSEADFQQLWKNPYCAAKCFREAVDDIVSDSFVFRSFRNEYETDNLFNQHSFNLLKEGAISFDSIETNDTEAPTNVYIPGYKVQSFLPSCSELTKQEMKECFPMYADICSNKNLTDEKLAIYNKYHDIIQKEQRLYQEIAKSAWYGINFRRANEIRSEVIEFTSKLWKKRLERLSWYPKHYMKYSDISLIDDSGKKTELTFSKQVECLGVSVLCFTPSLKQKRINVFNDLRYFENSDDFSDKFNVNKSYKYYKEIPSALSQKGYHPDVSKDKIAELVAVENSASIVMSASSFLCLLDNHPGVGARSWELPIVIKEYNEGTCKKRIIYIDKVLPPKSLTAAERIKWFCKKKIYELLKNCNNRVMNQKRNNKIVSYDDLDDFSSETSHDISKLECFGIESKISNVDEKKETSDKKKPTENSKSNSENNSSINLNKCLSSNDEQDDLGSDNDSTLFSADSENELFIDTDEEPADEEQNEVIEKGISVKKTTKSPQRQQPSRKGKLQDKIIYNLWSMRSESSNVLLKSNLKDLDIIIRCKEGAKIFQKRRQTHVISTKLEYQPEFGAEVTTLSEITRDWGNILVRPQSQLLRVRLDPITGDLIMYESKTVHDLTIEFQRQYLKSPYDKLTSLQALLGQLTELLPGNYLLSHSPENGTFAQLYKEERSKHNYNSNLGYLNVECNNVASSNAVWLQIDQMVLTPTCTHFYRIPAMFHPKVAKCSSKLDIMINSDKINELKTKSLIHKRKRRNQKKNKRNKNNSIQKKKEDFANSGSDAE